MKNQYGGGIAWKGGGGGLDSLLIWGGLGKKEGVVFLRGNRGGGGWYPNVHYAYMSTDNFFFWISNYRLDNNSPKKSYSKLEMLVFS